ncbi:unnamed protein product [Durusdinium trenchii]|uniref:PROP1-like PPR domain-containing protein n=2 Tax=Durusdinium trenchii TaxID=1381693 RepID=A0ABP0I2U4_9DINO
MGRTRGRAANSKEKCEDGAEVVREVPTPLRHGHVRATANILEEVMRRKGVDEAWDALEQMHAEGQTTDKYTVSRMLMKTVGDGHLDPSRAYRGIALVERFIEMQPEDVDEVLFNALLDTCCRLKDLKRLESCVNWMRHLKVKPSPITLGILVKTYGQAGDLDKVLAAWDEMEEQRGLANSVTYGCMLDACVKCGNLQKAVEVFKGMRETGKHRNTILYTTMIKGFGIHKDLENALELFHEMPDEGVPYNTITYNSILEACVKCGDVTSAEEILDQMVQTEYDIEPDLISYSTVLKGYCQNGDLLKALCMFQEMKEHSLRCDELVYNTLMEGCVKADDWKAGCGLFAEMVNKGLKPSAITASILSRLFQRVGHDDADEKVADLFMVFGLERPQPAERRARRVGHGHAGPSRPPPSPGVVGVDTLSPHESTPAVARSRAPAFAPSPTLSSPAGRTPLSRALMASLGVHEEQVAPLPTGRVVPALPGHGDSFHDQASTSSRHSRVPSLASLLPPLEFPEVPSRRPLASPATTFDGGSEVPTPQPPLSSPGVRHHPPQQPSLASLLHDDDQGRRQHLPPLASLLGPLDGAPEAQGAHTIASPATRPYQSNVVMQPIEPREAMPTPRRSAIAPPEGFGAFEAEPLPLSPATMLLSGDAEVPTSQSYSNAEESTRSYSASDPFQSFFSQDMWSYFSDGPARW